MSIDSRHRYLRDRVAEAFNIPTSTVEEVFQDDASFQLVGDFFKESGPPKIVFYYQPVEVEENGEMVSSGEKKIQVFSSEALTLQNKCIYFIRNTKKAVSTKDAELSQDIICGVIDSNFLSSFETLLREVYMPMFTAQSDWGKSSEEQTKEFLGSVQKFIDTVAEVAEIQSQAVDLRMPEKKLDIPQTPAAFAKLAAEPDTVAYFENYLSDWCTSIDQFLAEQAPDVTDSDGPLSELEWWKGRMRKLSSLTEQLKGRGVKVVLGVLNTARSRGLKRWKTTDNSITDASNEAKDNVKYLLTLEKYFDILYNGSPNDIIDSLPGLLNNIKMMYTIARYYNTPERMTTLFVKITNQMIMTCKDHVRGENRLWDQDTAILIPNLKAVVELNEKYKEQFRLTKERLMANPKGKQFDFTELQIFGKFELFCKRVQKLVDVFVTVEQFTTLSKHNIDGMEPLLGKFFQILDDVKQNNKYDLLDHTKTQFDKAYMDFGKNIQELETALQVFINSSFENINSTESALALLKKFQTILQRETLRGDLDSKYLLIFHNYGLDLETVQKTYERHKASPPTVRNAPPVAGNIIWCRQLLRRIEEPMLKFQANRSIMGTKESKKVIKTYNKVARALIEFETLWLNAWQKSVETAKAGLQATLLIKDNNRLYVNFDREILQLIRETKALIRLGVDVPDSARMVLLQEEKFKHYHNSLVHTIKEYERAIHRISPIIRPLLIPHLEDLERKLLPGMASITWTSMNIDGFLAKIQVAIQRFDDFVKKINDVVENLIDKNLKAISKTILVDVPSDMSFPLDQFVSMQERLMKQQCVMMNIRSMEVEKSVNQLISLISSYSLEETAKRTTPADMQRFRDHYKRLMVQAALNACIRSLNAIKKRVGSSSSKGFLFVDKPFFEVNTELNIPSVALSPSLDDVQQAINSCAISVLNCVKSLADWGSSTGSGGVGSGFYFYNEIAKNKEIVKVVLLLTGGVFGLRKQVNDYLNSFKKYEYLWREDKQAVYDQFMKTNPTLEDFEAELKKYMAIEQEISNIVPMFYIGSLSLQTQPLKYALKAEASAWKEQYARNLHGQARIDLMRFVQYMDDSTKMLQRDINDLEDLRYVMDKLKEIRERESEIDMQFGPIEDMYALLAHYDVRVPKEEVDAVGDLRYKWKKLRILANEVNEKIASLQGGFKKDLIRSVRSFAVDVIQFRNEYETHGPNVIGIKPQEAMERLKKYQRLYEERERKFETYRAGEELFGLPISDYPELAKTKKELALLEKLYSLYLTVIQTVNGYADILWVDLSFKEITDEVSVFANQCKKLPKQLRDWDAFKELKQTIDDFLELQPLLEQLYDKAVKPRHWHQIMQMTGKTFKLEPDVFRLRHILEANLLAHKDDIEEICTAARKELEIENKLKVIVTDWTDISFTFSEFKHRGPIILKGQETSEIMEKLEDSQMTLGSMMGSRYLTPFREEVSGWLLKLSNVAETIEVWMAVQSMWIYLEAVFASGDIAKQLPQEAKRFSQIDKNWCKIMAKAYETRNVVNFSYGNDLLKSLPYLREQLELCQKSLSGYLEQKRNMFPRFYFVSDPVLLEILSQSSDPHSIQPHLQSIFDSMYSVTFDAREKNKITDMQSPEKENVTLESPVIATGNVEDWLSKLELEMMSSIRSIIRECAQESSNIPLTEMIRKFPAQVALLGIQFKWTADAQDAIVRSKTEKKAMADANKNIAGVLAELTILTTRDLSPLDRTKIETLITIQVHQRDVFDELYKSKIKDIGDFDWQKQARFYWRADRNTAILAVADIETEYCYEYLGCKERLVITPLTDRCYITLTQALGMYLGGAPAGPAGTGKTETTKDLGRGCGKYVVVFNCSDQMDFRAMGKIFKGLCQSGSWGCFDEFNRIELEVLSVVAQQVQCVLAAMRDHKDNFTFTDGQQVKLIDKCGFFITMNPGYAGRVELPENLKALFRGVTMMVPDRRIIIKVKLAAAGFLQNEPLSLKFQVLYSLCEQQLSKQTHYDFGLRNILSVLRTAGSTKRANPDKKEDYLLMRTLRDMNMSKLVAEDVPLFMSLINDLFPGMKADKARFPAIEAAIEDRIRKGGLVNFPSWYEKVIQLYETCLVRHGIMVVGPTGTGKSACFDILLKALSDVDKPHKSYRMNPKAITAPQMFGRLDPISNDWTDGIFAALWRKANKQKNLNIWIICDGPVDAVWIENLNTVLDDNKLLTLANGDRIQMASSVKMTFEVENLANASPATVSRAGQIYMSDSVLGWKPVFESKMAGTTPAGPGTALCKPAQEEVIKRFFDSHVDGAFDFIRKECSPAMSISPVNQAVTTLDIFMTLLREFTNKGVDPADAHLERMLWFSLVWGIGGVLEIKDRTKFDTWIRKQSKNVPQSANETIYEYFVDEQTTEWDHWNKRINPWQYPGDAALDFPTLYVPTLDSVRLSFLLKKLAAERKSVLFIGGSGTAKTVTIEQFLMSCDPETMAYKKMNFSSATSPLIFQRTLESAIEKRMGTTFGPAGGKKMTVFVDDISMPEINEWGDQVTNEIVRQAVEDGGVYNLDKPGEWKTIVDLQYVAAMNHPGGGKNDIPNRLKRHFSVFNVTLPNKTSIDQIYGSILRGRFCRENGYAPDIVGVAEKLTEMTITFWQRIAAKMLPTPSKFHYIFNLRDLSRVYQGILNSPREVIVSDTLLLQLWRHECTRVFSDRLNTVDDKKWYDENIMRLVREHFPEDKAALVQNPVYFVNFLREPKIDPDTGEEVEPAPKIYEPAPAMPELRTRLELFLKKFNEASRIRKLDLVLFDAAIKNLIRISRILSMPRGNALLVGVGGSGKQSLTRSASFIAGFDTFQITLTKSYNQQNLFDDLRALFKTTGLAGKPVTFIFTDNEIKQETFLEYINNVLSSGEVAGLFAKDELDMIVNDLRPVAKRLKPDTIGKNDTWDNLYRYFIDRVRENLHLVLCFSPVGEKFRTRARKFPGLISGCTINWFFPWPEEALVDVATRFLDSFKMDTDDETKYKLVRHMAAVHRSMTAVSEEYFAKFRRNVYSTPRSYLSFIQNYKQVYADKYAFIFSLADKLNGGLGKLKQAGEDVERMKIELKSKEISLAEAQKATDILLTDITASTAKAEKKKAEVSAVKEVLSVEAGGAAQYKAQVENDLLKAKPALEAAERALSAITVKDIQMLKALKSPPDLVKRIFDGVLVLKQQPLEAVQAVEYKGKLQVKDSYPFSLAMMSQSDFLPSLLNFARDQVNDETVELVGVYLAQEDFNFETAKKASGNVAGLCTWVEAMCTYHDVSKDVQPKMEALRVAEGKLRIANGKLRAKEDELAEVEADLARIQSEFDGAMRKKQELQEDAERTRKRMEAANSLINALGGERDRWTTQSNEFKDLIRRLVGDVANACAFISYCGPYNSEFRSMLLKKNFYDDCVHRGIPVTPNLSITKFLVDDAQVGEWNLQGLPSDDHSIQNGIMITRSSKWPLLIDPQGQGLAWLKKRNEANNLRVCQITDRLFRNFLEDALSFGKPLIIENVEEEIDPFLDPVLEKAVIKQGRSMQIMLSDKAVDYAESFQLFMTTKLANPHYSPELSAKTTIIDFTVTMGGLEQQLLGRVIQKEKAELEEQREKLLADINSNQKRMKQLEDDLLFRLSSSTGNLLDDEELILVLANTKRTASEVKEKLTVAFETDKRINLAREEYRPVATRGSVLYFLVVEMSLLNPMYQTSLKQFLEVFDSSIARADKAPLASKRIANIIEYLSYALYLYMSRGLFERHKLIFVLLMACKVMLRAGTISPVSFGTLLKGGAALDIKSVRPKPFDWIPDLAWLNIIQLAESVKNFKELPDLIQRTENLWKYWYDQEAPEQHKIPDLHDKLDFFERLLLVRSLRDDRTMLAATDFIREALGKRYVDPVPFSLDAVVNEANERCPLIFLLSMGSDPTSMIEALAKKRKKEIRGISMGQGQEEASRRLLQGGFASGSWVMLQNCHLGLKFMTEVEQTLLNAEEVHPEFRLWITSEPHIKFPMGLLQMSIKLTNEAPQGVKAGLKRSFQWVNQDMLDAFRRPEWRPLIYSICFLHTTVQERRKFGPLGFNVPYEFNQSDLSASIQFLQNHIGAMGDDPKKGQPLQWNTIKYMVCEVQYGGRITDDFDRRTFNTYGDKMIGPEVCKGDFNFFPGFVNPNGNSYTIPVFPEIDKYREFIENLPLVDRPEVFGLHANADIAYRTKQSQEALATILDIQPKSSGGSGGASREEICLKLADDFLKRLPDNFNKDRVKEMIRKMGGGTPLNVVLAQEIDRLDVVISVVRRSLLDLKLAIAGTIIMSANLQNVLDSLFDARVATTWLKVSWPSPTLGLWFTDVLQRHDQLYKWLETGRPKSFWLTGFFNPQGFLTAVRQEVTRSHSGWALDDVVLKNDVTKMDGFADVKDAPSEGAYIHGMFLEGGSWDKKTGRLVDSPPKVLTFALPVVYITAILNSDKKKSSCYISPVYKNPSRTGLNYVFDLELACDEHPSKWIHRGMAVMLSAL